LVVLLKSVKTIQVWLKLGKTTSPLYEEQRTFMTTSVSSLNLAAVDIVYNNNNNNNNNQNINMPYFFMGFT
jgi:hypothetical protein